MRSFLTALSPLLLLLPHALAGKLSPTDTITWGGDNSRSGYQDSHNIDPSTVGSDQFGQLWKASLPGNYNGLGPEQIYSQPLVYTLNDGIQYVFIATTQNNIYKINAKTGDVLLSRNLHVPFLTKDLNGCVDINPTVGVTGTGVIDPDTDTWYFTAKTYSSPDITGLNNGRYFFHAIDVNTLAEKPNFPKGLEGTLARNNPNRMFQGGIHHQRPGLLHTGQYVYAGFASHCVQWNFTGWVIGWDKTTGAQVEQFTTEGGKEPNTVPGGGIWMSGGGIATDGKGSMYLSTGNGYSNQLAGTPVPGRQPPTSLEEAVVNFKINEDGSLGVVDFFMPWEKQQLDGADKDLGTTPFELLPPSTFNCPNVKRMGIVTGKSGKTYVLNLDNLGGYQMGQNKLDAIPFSWQNENSVYAGAGVYPGEGGYVYINVIQYQTHAYKFSCDDSGNPTFTKVADTLEKNAYVLGTGHASVTSLRGQAGSGLLWVSDVDGYNLRIYNAVPQAGQMQLLKAMNVPGITKFTRLVFGDGRAYMGSTIGALYCFGSPVNLPLTCNSPAEFGTVTINSTSQTKTIQCQANVDTTVNNITLADKTNFQISNLPTLPFALKNGQNISFQAVFAPVSPGPLSKDVVVGTENGVKGFSKSTPVSLKGTGNSLKPLLSVSPNLVSFSGVIVGQQAGGVTQSLIWSNLGDGPLTVNGVDYSVVSEKGALVTPNNTAQGSQVGPFTFSNIPTTIAGNSQKTINVNFNPTTSGNFAVYVRVRSDGGTKIFDVVGTAGTYPKALFEFQAADGSGKWIPYTNNTPPFTFGDVYEQKTRTLKMRLTNNGASTAGALSVTVSKPPFGVPGIIGAVNQVDLGEGVILQAGESATAELFCSVPKSQVNSDSYNGTAQWTINTGDPTLGKQFIQFVCNAVTEQVGPLYSNASAVYRYQGCYKENNPGRQLQVQLWGQNANNNNGDCINACTAKGYPIVGTQYVDECWCGKALPVLKTEETNCNYECSGNETQTCGGNGYFHDGSYISLFVNGTGFKAPDPNKKQGIVNSTGAYNYAGCYTEGTGGRALGDASTTSNDNSIEFCAKYCDGANYFGVEYGAECYCGSKLGVGSVKKPDTDCSMNCPGDNLEFCGAGGRLGVYQLNSSAITSSSSASVSASASATGSPTSVTPTASSATSAGPTAVQTAGTYAYQGCLTEATSGRALGSDQLLDGQTMTVEKCAAYCSNGGYSLMGLEYSSECYCANTLGQGAVPTTDGCTMTCSGNKNQLCGGPFRLNYYKAKAASSSTTSSPTSSLGSSITGTVSSIASSSTVSSSTSTTVSGPTTVPSAGGFNFLGCYTEATNQRALSDKQWPISASTVTVDACAAACKGYTYFGVEYGSECYCGNTLNAGSVVAAGGSSPAANGCSMTCAANKNQYCGGSNRLNVYRVGTTSSSTSSGSTATTSKSSSTGSMISSTTAKSSSVSSSITSKPSSMSSTTSTSSTTSKSASPTPYPGNTQFTYQGCYMDSTGSRTLPQRALANDQMTAQSCFTACAQYQYAAMEYGRECWCGNTLGSTGVKASAESQCSMKCAGDSSQLCGDANRMNLYIKASSSSMVRLMNAEESNSSTFSFTSKASTTSSSATSTKTSASSGTTSKSSTSGATTKASTSGVTTKASTSSIPTSATSKTSTSTTSTTIKTLTPTPSQTIGVYKYLGCANETSPRALAGYSLTSTTTTTESCQKLCKSQNYGLAATEAGNACYCGNGLQSFSAYGLEKNCNTACGGNKTEICGGVDATSGKKYLSVWSSLEKIPPTTVKQVGYYPVKGCYTGSNLLTKDTKTDTKSMSVESCVGYCSTKGYTLAGLTAASTCLCDNTLATTAKVTGLEQCNVVCSGNPWEFCGGKTQLLVYSKNATSVDSTGKPASMNQDNSKATITPAV